jgi:hypothetical protein
MVCQGICQFDGADCDQHAHPAGRGAGEGRDHFIAFNSRSTLPSKARSTPALATALDPNSRRQPVELVAMQPIAQRDLARLRTVNAAGSSTAAISRFADPA